MISFSTNRTRTFRDCWQRWSFVLTFCMTKSLALENLNNNCMICSSIEMKRALNDIWQVRLFRTFAFTFARNGQNLSLLQMMKDIEQETLDIVFWFIYIPCSHIYLNKVWIPLNRISRSNRLEINNRNWHTLKWISFVGRFAFVNVIPRRLRTDLDSSSERERAIEWSG